MPEDQMFQGFNLSEIHAAQAVAPRANGRALPPRLNRPEVRMVFHALRLALRSLRRRPGFSAIAVSTIALGAGANAAVFCRRVRRPAQAAAVRRTRTGWLPSGRDDSCRRSICATCANAPPGSIGISGIAPGWTFSLTGAGDPSRITVDRVSGNLFETLGTRPLLGRADPRR